MFWGLIILNCTIKTRRIYFGAANKGIKPKNSFTLVLLVHVPYPTFPQLSSFKSFCYFIFPFFAIIIIRAKHVWLLLLQKMPLYKRFLHYFLRANGVFVNADYASKPMRTSQWNQQDLCFVVCTSCNRRDSRATQYASPLAHRSPNDNSASNNHELFFYFFIISIFQKEYCYDGWHIVRSKHVCTSQWN